MVEDLYAKFPDVEALAAAPVEEIEKIVKPCGLGHSKARDISACMKILQDPYQGSVPDDFDKLPVLERRIKRPSPTGEQVALASSEIIPAGSTMKFAIRFTDPKSRELVYEWLNYGTEHGLGAWRNSGRGVFQWRLLNDDWSPRT